MSSASSSSPQPAGGAMVTGPLLPGSATAPEQAHAAASSALDGEWLTTGVEQLKAGRHGAVTMPSLQHLQQVRTMMIRRC